MMRFFSHLAKVGDRAISETPRRAHGRVPYESVLTIPSRAFPGVTLVIRRVSFGRRMELSRRARELSQRAEFLAASNELQEKIEANILTQEIDAMYMRWGLVSVDGLSIDGELATVDQLLDSGPEELTQEALAAIRGQCGLSEAERKN